MSSQANNTQNSSAAVKIPVDASSVKANRMATLLSIEASAREAGTFEALAIHLVNDPRNLTPYDQAFCLRKVAGDKFKVIAITSQDNINPHAPSVQMAERFAQNISRTRNPEQNTTFTVDSIETEWIREQKSYPFKNWSWLPLLSPEVAGKQQLLGGILLARKTPWRDLDLIVLSRIVETYAHSWSLIELSKKKSTPVQRKRRMIIGASIAAICLAMCIPVPYTVVAPAQIIAAEPVIISAPVDGVIHKVHVNPNQTVATGDKLITFVDTTLRNNAQIAENELLLAQAKRANTNRAAIIDNEQRRDLAVLDAERALAQTKRLYANDLLDNVELNATNDGVALFADKSSLSGKPVVTGEKIMEIADPTNMEILVEVSPADALSLKTGQKISIFLDTDPLHGLKGTLTRANFTPSEGQSGQLVYKGFVTLNEKPTASTRIGLRGSAKLTAGKTVIGYWLFRKPIAIVRRQLGL